MKRNISRNVAVERCETFRIPQTFIRNYALYYAILQSLVLAKLFVKDDMGLQHTKSSLLLLGTVVRARTSLCSVCHCWSTEPSYDVTTLTIAIIHSRRAYRCSLQHGSARMLSKRTHCCSISGQEHETLQFLALPFRCSTPTTKHIRSRNTKSTSFHEPAHHRPSSPRNVIHEATRQHSPAMRIVKTFHLGCGLSQAVRPT